MGGVGMVISLSTHRKLHELLDDAARADGDVAMSLGRDAGREVCVLCPSGVWTVSDLWKGGQIWGCSQTATGAQGGGVEFEGPVVAKMGKRGTGEAVPLNAEGI